MAWFADKNQNAQHKTDPFIQVNGHYVRLALSTDQLPRTFEDRSYTFNILTRPASVSKTERIYNINVQGKRGNIAQVRNCFEYDFVPNNLTIEEKDYLHFQWVGSDFNPQNNDGEGRAGTDRSNVVEISDFLGYNRVINHSYINASFIPADLLANFTYLAQLAENCFTYDELILLRNTQSLRNCALLNNASVYFNSRLFKINISSGNVTNRTYYYMSTRNNNFSNRNQKGIITVLKSFFMQITTTVAATVAATAAQNERMPIIAIVFLSLFCTVFFTAVFVYTYRNHSRLRKYITRSTSAQV